MPGYDDFKIVIDSSALDALVPKAKAASAELITIFNKSSDNLKTLLTKAFPLEGFQTFLTNVKAKTGELKSAFNTKYTANFDTSQILGAVNVLASARSNLVSFQKEATRTATVWEQSFVGASSLIITRLREIASEEKKLQAQLSQSKQPAAGVSVFPEYIKSMQVQRQALKKEQLEAESILQIIRKTFLEAQKVRDAANKLVVEASTAPTGAFSAIRKFKGYTGSTSGKVLDLPTDETSKQLQDYAKHIQAKSGQLEDSMAQSIENMISDVSYRLQTLPDTTKMNDKMRRYYGKQEESYKQLLDDLHGLRNKRGASHDILGAFEGKDLLKILEKLQMGGTDYEAELKRLETRAVAYDKKLTGFFTRYANIMEEIPAHIKAAGGGKAVPGTADATWEALVQTTSRKASRSEINALKKELKALEDSGAETEKIIQEIQSKKAQIEYLKKRKISQLPEVVEGTPRNVRGASSHAYSYQDFHRIASEDAAYMNQMSGAWAHFQDTGEVSAETIQHLAEWSEKLGVAIKSPEQSTKSLRESINAARAPVEGFLKMIKGETHGDQAPSLRNMKLMIESIAREPILKPGSESLDYAQKLKSSLGNATGFVKRELTETSAAAETSLFKFKNIVVGMGSEITKPFQPVIDQILGVKDATGKMQGIGPQFRIGGTNAAGEKVPYLEAFEERLNRIQALAVQVETAPAEALPKLNKEMHSLSTSLFGVGDHFKKVNVSASDMSNSFRVKPLIDDLHTLFNSPDLNAKQLAQAQSVVGQINTRFDQMVKFAPALEPLRKQMQGLATDFLKTKSFTAVDKTNADIKKLEERAVLAKQRLDELQSEKPKSGFELRTRGPEGEVTSSKFRETPSSVSDLEDKKALARWRTQLGAFQKEYDSLNAQISSKKISLVDQQAVKKSFDQFATSLAPFAKQLNFTQVVSDALMQLARLARGAGDVGRNTSNMADQAQRFVELLKTASVKGLTSSEGESLRKITSDMDNYTVKLRSEHLPIIQTLGKEYDSFHNSIGSVVGRFLTSPGRGVIPELIRQKFAPEGKNPAIQLEEWMEGSAGAMEVGHFKQPGSRGDVRFEPIHGREQFDKQWREITYPTGTRQERELTTAEMFGTGRFELIDSVNAKVESFGRTLGFLKNKLGESGAEFENLYQPAMKTSVKLSEHIQKLREAALMDASRSPHMSSIVLSLDAAQASINHTTSSFKFLKHSLDSLDSAGGVVSPEWTAKVEKGLQSITKTATSTVKSGVRQYQDRLKNILGDEESSPSRIYSAVKEGMKLPMSSTKEESVTSRGLGNILFGGKDSFMQTADMGRIAQVRGALSEYAEEVLKSGFNTATVQRAAIAVKRIFAEMDKVVNDRRVEYFKKNKKHLEWSTDPSEMPSWQAKDLETPALSKHMKGIMRGLTEAQQEADPKTYPAMDNLIKRATSWPEDLVNKRMVLLKRHMSKMRQEIVKEMNPEGQGISAAGESMLIKNINFERAYEAMEKAKSNISYAREKQEARLANRVFATQPQRPTEVEQNRIITAPESDLAIIPAVAKTKAAVVGSIDEMTKAKEEALRRQIQRMQGVGVGKAVEAVETEAVAKVSKGQSDLAGILSTSAKESETSLIGPGTSKRIRNLINPIVSINNSLETMGQLFDKAGKPLALWPELARAARQNITELMREVSKTGVSTESLDKQVAKHNKGLPANEKVLPYSDLIKQETLIKQKIDNASGDFWEATKTNNVKEATAAYTRLQQALVALRDINLEYEKTISATMNKEFLQEDLRRREIVTIHDLGLAYRMATLESESTMGPSSISARAKIAETGFAGRDIASQSLITTAFAHTGLKEGGMFENVGGPFATINDLYRKLLEGPQQLKQLGPGISTNVDTYRKLVEAYGMDIPEPKNLDSLAGRLKRLNELPDGKSFSARWTKDLDRDLGRAQDWFRQILTGLDNIALKSNLSQYKEARVAEIQKQRDSFRGMIHDTEQFIKLLQEANSRQGPLGGLQERIQLQELGSQRKQDLAQRIVLMRQDKETPDSEITQAVQTQAALNRELKDGMSIWERITNTVKSARNNFADLFMYQVRWYTSMMLFWGVINKVSETFKGMADTQHQIQRAVRSMRDESGELVTHYERLERLSTIHIFDNMVKWAVDAKMAGEALYQLASAGLNVTESLAALGPVLSLVRATEADTQETVKIVAGVYNVLGDTIESNIAITTRFKIISDVMTKVFNDHQVELSELNQGYRFAIQSADMAGLSFYELSAMLGVLNDNMIKGMRAGRGLQQVLVHIAKQPYEIAASFLNLAKHMNVPAEVYSKLASPNIAKMTTMELMREFAKIAQASGKSMEQLGRIMEKFDMIGGRTLAPLLMKFHEVDKTSAQLLFNSMNSTQAMASRMSTTITANLRRIASYMQSSFYPVIQGVHLLLVGVMSAVGSLAMKLGGMQTSVVKGAFGAIPFIGSGLGNFMDHLTKSIVLITTLLFTTNLFPEKYRLIEKGLEAIGTRIQRLFAIILAGTKGMTAAQVGSNIAGAFGAIIAPLKSVIEHYKQLRTTQSIANAAWLASLGGIKGALEQLKLLILWLGRNPVALAIIAISGAIAGILTWFYAWRKSYDELVADATEANTRYLESLGKLEQKAVQAWHAIVEAGKTGKVWKEVSPEGSETDIATPAQKDAFNAYTRSLGIVDDTAGNAQVTIGTLRKRMEELREKIDDSTRSLNYFHTAISRDPKIRKELDDTVEKQVKTIVAARKEFAKAESDLASERAKKDRGVSGSIFGLMGFSPENLAEAQRVAREAHNSLSQANTRLMETIQTPITANLRGPIETMIESMRGKGLDDKSIKKDLLALITPPKDAAKIKWKPELDLKGMDWNDLIPALVPDDKIFKKVIGDPKILEKLVGQDWGAAIDKAGTMMEKKQLFISGRIAIMGAELVKKPLENAGIQIGPAGAWGKEEQEKFRQREIVLKTEMSYEKQWNETMQKLLQARVLGMSEGYTAQQASTEMFGLEMTRLLHEYEKTEEEHNLKIETIRKKWGAELNRPGPQAELQNAILQKQMALLKVQQEQLGLVKQMAEFSQKTWQESTGEQLKHSYLLKNIQAREAEANAAQKVADIERKIASNVRVTAQEVQAAHELKMNAIRLELDAKQKELQYNYLGEKQKLEQELRGWEPQMWLGSDKTDEQRKFAERQRQYTLDRMARLEEMHAAQRSAAGAEAERKTSEEARKAHDLSIQRLIHNLKIFKDEVSETQAAVRSTLTQTAMLTSSLRAPMEGVLTSVFSDDRKGRPKGHHGGDISGKVGQPFYAPTDMRVEYAKDSMSDSPGGMVWGVDAKGVWHKFHHVKPGVTRGQQVKVGEQLGVLSNISGPHLDYKQSVGEYGAFIDWMSAAGLRKGDRIGKVIPGGRVTGTMPLTTSMGPTPGLLPTPKNIGEAMEQFVSEAEEIIRSGGPEDRGKIKNAISEFLSGLRDMQLEPFELTAFEKAFDKFGALWQKVGGGMKKFHQLTLESYKKMFDKGDVLEIPLLVKYVTRAGLAGETEEQRRKRVFEVAKVAFEHEESWTKEKMGGLLNFIGKMPESTGVSGKKLYSYLFSEVFSPSKLQVMIDSDIESMERFYDGLANLGRNLSGGVPVKVMKSFETAIKGIIGAGEELDAKKYDALINTLAKISSINLKEAADSVEKYWQSIANIRKFNTADFGKMQSDMMRFGATEGEVWKAIGEVADVQIRRLYAEWDKGAKGMKDDMNTLKGVGDAFWLGMVKGVADFAAKIKDPIRQLAESVTQIMTDMQSSLQTILEDSLKGDWKGWNEYSTKFGENMIKLASKNISEMAMGSLSNLIGKALGLPEPKKPGTLTQTEAEAGGKASAEQQARFNTEGILKETKRSADGIEKLVTIAEQKEGISAKEGEGITQKSSGTKEGTVQKAGGVSEPSVSAPGVTASVESKPTTPITTAASTPTELERRLTPFVAGEPTEVGESKKEAAPTGRARTPVTVKKVLDADTMIVQDAQGASFPVRFSGIDAPESRQKGGAQATEFLKQFIEGKKLEVDIEKTDKYKRKIGTVFADGQDVNAELVKQGQAWWYEKYSPDRADLKESQLKAREEKRGLWAEENPMAPWDWRHANKKYLDELYKSGHSDLNPVSSYEEQKAWENSQTPQVQPWGDWFSNFLNNPLGFAKGGVVPGSGGTDSVPAMLTPGEIVLSRALVRRFAEGGEVENPLQSLLSGVGEMVQGMMAPLTKMMSPRAQQIAQIGEGNYGGTFEAQGAWDDQFEQVRGMYRQQDAQKYAEYQKGQIQQALGGGGGGNPLSMIPIIGGLFKSEGGLIQQFGLGGLVQFLATGGSVLQKDINPSLYQAHVTSDGKLYSNWPDIQKAKPTPWYEKMLPWLMMAPLLLSFLGGKDKKSGSVPSGAFEKIGEEKFRLDPGSDPMQGGGGIWNTIKGWFGGGASTPSTAGATDSGGFLSNLTGGIGTTGIGDFFSGIGSFFGFAEGGPVIQTRSEAERPWQNMGHTETVWEGQNSSTWWQKIRPYLLMSLPLLMKLAQKKKSATADSSPEMELLSKQMGGLKSPNLEPKSMDDMFKNYLTGGSDKPGDLNTALTKYLEKGKETDWLSDAKLDKSLFDTSDLQSTLSKATTSATSTESGGFLSSLGNLFSGGGGGFLSNLGSLGSSLWGGLKGLGSGLLSIFGFAEGGQVPHFAEGGMLSGLLSSGLGLVGSIFGPIGSIAGSLFGSLFGGLFGGKKKSEDSGMEGVTTGGGLFSSPNSNTGQGQGGGLFSGLLGGLGSLGSGLMGGLGSLGSGILGIGKSLFSGIGSIFGLSNEITGLGSKGGLGTGTGLGGIFSGIGSLFGFAEGGFVDSLLNMLGPSQAQAMPLDQVMPSLTAGWEKGLNDLVMKNPDVKNQSAEFLQQAKLGVSDVTNFLKDKPNMFDPINKLVGTVNVGQQSSGFYRQFNEMISANLDPLKPGEENTRQSIANLLFHETAHGLTKSGRSLAPFLNQLDPKETLAWANELVKNGQLDPKDVEYWSDPYEVMARGVSGHLQQAMDPKVAINPVDYPPEYRELFESLSKGLITGKMPKASGGVGILETLRRSATDIQAGRLPQAVFGYASGGTIPGAGDGDTVPAMLTPGEFVINKRTVNLFGPQFFHALQDLAKTRGAAASPDVVLAGARQNLRFAAGGVIPKLPPVSTAPTENKITVATVMDEESVGQFLNTKKYGEVLVNKLGSGITRRMQGGQGI